MVLSRIVLVLCAFVGNFAGANDSLSLMQKQTMMLSDDNSDEDGDISSSTEDLEWEKITCPVMGALFKAGDLIPNKDGVVTKAQTREAMMRAGISEKRSIATTDGNFDHLPGDKEINLFNMDLQMAFDKPLKLRNKEHDFSTGVRDGAKPNAKAYKVFEQFIGSDGDSNSWSQTDIRAAIEYYKKHSNDLGSGMGGIKSLALCLLNLLMMMARSPRLR